MKWQPWLRALVVVAALVLGWLLRTVTVPLLAAYLVMLVWRPVHLRMSRKMGKGTAAILCVVGTVLLPLVLIIPTLGETDELAELLPSEERAQELTTRLQDHIESLVQKLPEGWRDSMRLSDEDMEAHLAKLPALLESLGASFASFMGGLFGLLSSLVLLPIFLFFLLQGGPWLAALRREVPPDWHAKFDRIFPRIEAILRAYCRSRVLVAGAKGMLIMLILLIAGIPAWYTLGLMAGVLSLIPVLGPIIAFLGLALVAFAAQGGAGLAVAIGAYIVAEVVEGYVLMPRLVGRGLGLSDFTVILAALAGGALLGIFGLLVAVPLVAVSKVLYDEFVRPVMGTSGETPAEA